MDTAVKNHWVSRNRALPVLLASVAGAGFLCFAVLAMGPLPETAWLIFLTNFLLFSAVAHGAFAFSAIMHFTKARWSHRIAPVAEAFTAFFPVSILLFLILFLGQKHLFTWIGEDLHGKEVWLNVPFLFTRDLAGLLILKGLGLGYWWYSLRYRLRNTVPDTWMKKTLARYQEGSNLTPEQILERKTWCAGFYLFAFAMVLSLIGFDLVMSMDAHWYSTLFGAYSFIKAIFAGLGGLILFVSLLQLSDGLPFSVTRSQLGDLCTLFFGFSIVWGDFFYSQFVVIWYGNISEETAYIIKRTMMPPWNGFAWTVFLVCFILPFIVLLSRKIKENPKIMIAMSCLVLTGFWLEHFLLLAPNYLEGLNLFSTGFGVVFINLGFLALMVMALLFYLRQFPEIMDADFGEVVQWK